jgi:hypothetical protein
MSGHLDPDHNQTSQRPPRHLPEVETRRNGYAD